MQNGEGERRSLAGASLGAPEQVLAFERGRDGLGLNRSWDVVTFFCQSTKNRFGKCESRKVFQVETIR